MFNWPGGWPTMRDSYKGLLNPTNKFYWMLAPGIGKHHLERFGLTLTDPVAMAQYKIPEVFLHAIT